MASAIEHILLVVENNPKKPLKQILARPDVRQAMSDPFARAGAETLQAVREAWDGHAGGDRLPDHDLMKTLQTVRANTIAAPARIRHVVLNGHRESMDRRLRTLSGKMMRSAEMSVEFADNRAYTLKTLHGAPKGAMKTWRSLNWENRCEHCEHLDGTTIPVNDIFQTSVATYGPLIGPQLHPHCQCWLEVS
jgi:hypothetical protein